MVVECNNSSERVHAIARFKVQVYYLRSIQGNIETNTKWMMGSLHILYTAASELSKELIFLLSANPKARIQFVKVFKLFGYMIHQLTAISTEYKVE